MEENYWWVAESITMNDQPLMISSSPPPPSYNNHHPHPQTNNHPPPPPMPLPQPQPMLHPQNIYDGYHLIEPNVTNQYFINPNIMHTIMNEGDTTEQFNFRMLTPPLNTTPTNTNRITLDEEPNNNNSPTSQEAPMEANPIPRPRGRPVGSKNKPKPNFLITNEPQNAMESVLLEIIHDNDIVECLKTYAKRYQRGMTVLSGSGFVKDITLSKLDGVIKLPGRHQIIALKGDFFPEPWPRGESGRLTVYFSGAQGRVVGGVVVGPLKVFGPVTIVAGCFTSTTLERVHLPFLIPHPIQPVSPFSVQMQVENIGTTHDASSSSYADAPPPPPPHPSSGIING